MKGVFLIGLLFEVFAGILPDTFALKFKSNTVWGSEFVALLARYEVEITK